MMKLAVFVVLEHIMLDFILVKIVDKHYVQIFVLVVMLINVKDLWVNEYLFFFSLNLGTKWINV